MKTEKSPIEVAANHEQRLFVIPSFNGKGKIAGYSCLGFQNCYDKTAAIVKWLNEVTGSHFDLLEDTEEAKSSLKSYSYYQMLCNIATELNAATGIRCNAELTPQLIGLEGKIVEVEDNSGDVRKFKVGKSTGWMPIHLEVEKNQNGGCGTWGTPYRKVTELTKWDKFNFLFT